MKISMLMNYVGDFRESARQVVELEKAGLDQVFVAEAYSYDAISQIGYLAAITDRVEIGTGIINVYSRTPALIAMTAAGLDYVSNGRMVLGLGASGPQVVEGFHGVAYDKPMTRIIETIEVCRKVWKRERLEYAGDAIQVPLPAGQGTGLGKPLKLINHPVRSEIPIWWASLMGKAVEKTAEVADGWLPILFHPERSDRVWGEQLKAGTAKRSSDLKPLEVAAGGIVAIGDDLPVDKILDMSRPMVALYVGGMGARGKNFYNDLAMRYGFEDEAREIQDLYLDGKKGEAAAAVPHDWIEKMNLVGPRSYVAERVAAFKEAGVTTLSVNVAGPGAVHTIEQLRDICDSV
jgi:F420-dependent oxidoreductase-like protein